ncbi:MAG: TolC family protein [Bacteroidia bacterium]|nr:TolC family protein [Bacteroidia bacterium]
MQKQFSSFILCFFGIYCSYGQQTQSLTLNACEEIFLKNNLVLLAQQYNINAKQALIIQAKAYPNPSFNADINVYDPQNNNFFHIDSSGQKAFQIQQLIYLGGKRKTEIDIAKKNKLLAESEFAELLRTLKVQLHTNFYSINSEKTVLDNYEKQLQILDTIINAYKLQFDKGNLPLKDIIRLKSVYIKLSSNRSELTSSFNEEQKQLKLLLQTTVNIIPIVSENDLDPMLNLKPINELQLIAASNRPDLKMADEQALIAAMNLKLQKKQRIPDLTLNASYDQRGGAFRNQLNAGVSMPIPLLNTNRGNIRAADFDKKGIELYAQEKKLEVDLDIEHAWKNMQRCIIEYVKVKSIYNEDFFSVNNGINDNFKKRNISILEFVDFVESYNESLADYEKLKKQLAISAAQINYVTASKIY